jgi:mRNA-degrading endonuclease RelE of RelBE toxin-antitoxin system
MKQYTVVWTASALDQLAEIWLQAPDRQAVSLAAARIDIVLAVGALNRGSELREGLRALEIAPLRVIFAVQDDDRLVEVARVSRM